MTPPARIGVFPDAQAKQRYFDTYDTAIAQCPTPVETLDVDTRFGATRVYRHGPDRGAPIVLLPAFWATSAMWAPNTAGLAVDHPVYSVDPIGQPGASVQTTALRTPRDCADWISDLLTALKLVEVHLIGCSYGGWLAFNQALHTPERLGTISLLEPASVFAHSSVGFKLTAPTLIPTAPRKLTRRAIARAFGNPTRGDPMNPIVDLIVAGAHDFRALGASPAPKYPNDATLRSLQVPTLVVFGGRSAYHHGHAAADRARSLLPDGEVELWRTASHAVSAEMPIEVNSRVLQFIRGRTTEKTQLD